MARGSEVGRFRWGSGTLCLDFVATLGRRGLPEGQRVERVPTPARLGEWLRSAGLVEGGTAVSDGDLTSAVVLREAINGLLRGLLAGAEVDADARSVNRWAAGPLPTPVFDPATRRVHHRGAEPVAGALTRIARDAVLTAGALDRLPVRICEQDDCRMLFLDQSRGKPRRWCSARLCGNRAKVAAYRQRRQHTI